MFSNNSLASVQGEVSIQAKFDRRNLTLRMKNVLDEGKFIMIDKNPLSLDNEASSVEIGELVFAQNDSIRGAGPVSAFSAFNGLCIFRPIIFYENDLRFIGIARSRSTHCERDKDQHAITVQIKGLNTIVNTGNHNIVAGDKVIWRLPTKKEMLERNASASHIRSKLVPITEPLQQFLANCKKADVNDATSVCTQFQLLSSRAITTSANIQDLQSYLDLLILGTATSSCKKNEKFDIVLR